MADFGQMAASTPTIPLPGANIPKRPPIKETDPYLASLPAYDQRDYYDSPSVHDRYGEHSQEGIAAYSGLDTNRGKKLHPAARSARFKRVPGWAVTLPTCAELDQFRGPKRQKLDLTNTLSLVSQEDIFNDKEDPDRPAQARLPAIPTNPAEVLISPFTATTFRQKESMLPTLALSAIGLIEADTPCVKALARACTILRGDEVNWDIPKDIVPLKIKPATKPSEKASANDTAKATTDGKEANGNTQSEKSQPAEKVTATAGSSEPKEIDKSDKSQEQPAVTVEPAQAKDSDVEMQAANAPASLQTTDGSPNKDEPIDKTVNETIHTQGEGNGSKEATDTAAKEQVEDTQMDAVSRSTSPDAPINSVNVTDDNATESEMVPGDEEHGGSRTSRGRGGQPAGGYEESASEEEEEEQEGAEEIEAEEEVEEETPLTTKWKRSASPETLLNRTRLLQPHSFVESMFVSPKSIALSTTHNPVNGSVYPPVQHIFTPNEQQVLLYASLAELQRLLADSLEYQNRLREISDGVLGVERRRKGLYKIIKLFASSLSC